MEYCIDSLTADGIPEILPVIGNKLPATAINIDRTIITGLQLCVDFAALFI